MRARSWNIALLRDGNEAPLTCRLEDDGAVALGEDRVVAPDPCTGAGTEARAALAHDDRSRGDALAVEDLDAEHLRVRVAPVPRRAESLLMSHPGVPSSLRAPRARPCASRARARTRARPRPARRSSGRTSP